MKHFNIFESLTFMVICLLGTSCNMNEKTASRQKIKFDYDWSFSKGDFANAYDNSFDDKNWKKLDLPHDWSISDQFAKTNPSGNSGGFASGGTGWYRKKFNLEGISPESKVCIEFGGVYMNSEVWINGHYLGKRPYGYISFNYDMTSFLNFEGENVLAVKVDNSQQPNARWYTGSGIYRHVWLDITNKLHVERHGVVAIPRVNGDKANVEVKVSIKNEHENAQVFSFQNEIFSADGRRMIAEIQKDSLASQDSKTITQFLNLEDPQLWSPESPYLYTLRTKIYSKSILVDSIDTKIGVRSVQFTKDKGFYLNGQNIKLMGVNEHSDLGALGAAVNEKVMIRRLNILKEMGCNAIRTAHNPPSEEFLDLCDSLGFMVMDEAFDEWLESWPFGGVKKPQGKVKYGYHLYFNEWSERDLTELIQRDRNHPSVILWSVGNEIPDACFEVGVERYNRLKEIVHKNDTTRLITCGITHMHLANKSGFASALDVTGYNGGGGSCFMYEKDRLTYPERIFVATEVPHSFQSRGIYRTKSWYRGKNPLGGIKEVPDYTEEEVFKDVPRYYSSSYDNAMVRIGARDAWTKTKELPYMAGEFRWTGFDYLGETMQGWPAKFWNFGIIDMCGFPKDTYYFYQSQWTKKPMVHILPHWTWPGKEGIQIPVVAYSNCEKVELFLNKKSLGEKTIAGKTDVVWMVPYEPGELMVQGKNGNQICCTQTVVTASEPQQIALSCDRTSLTTDKQDAAHIEVDILDKNGNFVPAASNRITFRIEGDLSVLGIDNGDPVNQDSFAGTEVNAFNGKCLLIVKSNGKRGKCVITATSPGLKSAQVELPIK